MLIVEPQARAQGFACCQHQQPGCAATAATAAGGFVIVAPVQLHHRLELVEWILIVISGVFRGGCMLVGGHTKKTVRKEQFDQSVESIQNTEHSPPLTCTREQVPLPGWA